MMASGKWHTTGREPTEYPDPTGSLEQYYTLREYPGGRLDVNIESWVTDTDFGGGITPAHFSYWGTGHLLGWQALPRPMTVDPVGWTSPYQGGDDPGKSDWYLCTTTRDYRQYSVQKVFWDGDKTRWSPGCLWANEEVIGWRPYPAPPRGRS